MKAENELLKKNRSGRKEDEKKEIALAAEEKIILISQILEKYKLKNSISALCKISGISRSRYYNYFTLTSQNRRIQRDKQDEQVKEILLKAYHFKGRKKGAQQIKMTLAGQYNVYPLSRTVKKKTMQF